MKYTFFTLFLSIFFVSVWGSNIEKHADGITIQLEPHSHSEAQLIRLQIINDKIVHVSATPESQFSEEKSLIVVPHPDTVRPFTVKEEAGHILLTTKYLQIDINSQNGEISFKDLNNQPILTETLTGKTFTPIEIEGTPGYTLHRIFNTDTEEAIYGLGQHQSDEFNYKGKNESLFQYNTKVAVPFVISTKNYGILWDNYSLTRYGDPRDYAQLNEVFGLYDKDGIEGGLTAVYTPDSKTGKQPVIRTEATIFYEDVKSILNLPEKFPFKGSQVSYTGTLKAKEKGIHRFHLYYAGYVKVYLNEELVVPERWRTAWNPNSYKFELQIEEGQQVPVRIEWKPDGDVSYLGLRALTPVPDEEQNKLSFYSEMGNEIDYYFIYGENMDEVISGYRTLTGKSPIMPKWAMGYWQSRERYKTQKEIVDALREFRKREIPIDNIVLDWSYWPEDAWGSHEFDKNRFPNPKAMVDSIHAMNAQVMISVWPKFYMNTEHFKEFDKNGWMYQQAIKDSLRDWIGQGYIGSFYDAYAEGARKLFWEQMEEHLYSLGIDAWWMDASEPNVKDCTDMEYRKALCGPTALGPSTQYFNAYALMNAQAIYEGLKNADPNQRIFQLTRSGFAGLQRYATATWSGDIGTRWEDMKAQISAGLNFAMSGIPYWTMDIGGFCVESRYEKGQKEYNKSGIENADLKEWRELNTRWYQFGAFTPLFRSHGQYPFREVYNLAPEDHPAYQSIVYYTKLRYNLMPYIYSLAGMTYFNDYTIMRALVMDFGKDRKVWDISDQYLFGSNIMVCPVYEYEAQSRNVYFPQGKGWYNFYTGAFTEGGQQQNVEAPYERMPLYICEGSIIPCGPDVQYTDEKQPEEITLYVYAGQDGSFSLYEDEGTNYNYEKGLYTIIPLNYYDTTRTLTIGKREGEYPTMLKNRTFRIVVIDKDNPIPFNSHSTGIRVEYNGEKKDIQL